MVRKQRRKLAIQQKTLDRNPEQAHATLETRKKLRQDVLMRLYASGKLEYYHLDAAKEIERMWRALGRVMFPSSRGHLPREYNLGKRNLDPFDRMGLAEVRIWQNRYLPWSKEMGAALLACHRTTKLQLTLDIVLDNYGMRTLEHHYGMRHGTAPDYLRAALERYAEIANWIRCA